MKKLRTAETLARVHADQERRRSSAAARQQRGDRRQATRQTILTRELRNA